MKTFIAALGASLMLANAAIAEPGDCSTAEVHYVARGFAGFTVGNIVGRCARMHPSIETQMRNAINGFVQKHARYFAAVERDSMMVYETMRPGHAKQLRVELENNLTNVTKELVSATASSMDYCESMAKIMIVVSDPNTILRQYETYSRASWGQCWTAIATETKPSTMALMQARLFRVGAATGQCLDQTLRERATLRRSQTAPIHSIDERRGSGRAPSSCSSALVLLLV